MEMDKLVAVVGPTCTGKSALALWLAATFNGEIINADSRQVYRYMDTGTARPTPEQMALAPHHLFSIINPDEDFSLVQYQQLAYDSIKDVHRRGRLPLLVGGSGLYVWAVLEGWIVPPVPPDAEYRRSLERRADAAGGDQLHRELARVDPATAEKIDPRNVRRVIRALEVNREKPFAQSARKQPPAFQTLIIGLTSPRKALYARADARVDNMVASGLVEEVRRLLSMGYSLDLPSMSSIGYREIGAFLQGRMTLDEAVYRIKVGTHRFIRHQYAWFKLDDERIHWFEANDASREAIGAVVKSFVAAL